MYKNAISQISLHIPICVANPVLLNFSSHSYRMVRFLPMKSSGFVFLGSWFSKQDIDGRIKFLEHIKKYATINLTPNLRLFAYQYALICIEIQHYIYIYDSYSYEPHFCPGICSLLLEYLRSFPAYKHCDFLSLIDAFPEFYILGPADKSLHQFWFSRHDFKSRIALLKKAINLTYEQII